MIHLSASFSNKLSNNGIPNDFNFPLICYSLDVIVLKNFTCTFQVYKGHTGVVRCIAVDPSGQWIASGTACDKISAASCCIHCLSRITSTYIQCSPWLQ